MYFMIIEINNFYDYMVKIFFSFALSSKDFHYNADNKQWVMNNDSTFVVS